MGLKTRHATSQIEYEQLECPVLLCHGQRVTLTSNLWVSASLLNGSLKQVVDIFYKSNHHPPQLPTFVVVNFQKYIGPTWDTNNPTFLPITPIQRGRRTQIPLKMDIKLMGFSRPC